MIKNDEVKKVRWIFALTTTLRCKVVFSSLIIFVTVFQDEPSQNVTPDAGTEASPVKRRGRPPKATGAPAAEKEGAAAPAGGGAGRGRKRAADPNSSPSAESINIKMSKQQAQNDEGTKRQIDLQR